MRELVDMVLAELRGSWRFRWFAVLVAWVVCVAGWAAVSMLPDEFESEATVLIDTSSALDELLRSLTINPDVIARVEAVRTALLSRPRLEEVARETDLHLRAKSDKEMDGLISSLRSRITISGDRRTGGNLYKITYRDRDRRTAYAVVNSLLNSFVEDTLGANREGSDRAQEFLRTQIANLEIDLTEAEERLANFKRENVGRMPSEQGGYFSRLDAEMTALERTQSELRQLQKQRETLLLQLAGEQPTLESNGPQSELDRRIADNKRRLAELELRFTDRHPDVIALKETLAELDRQKQQQLEDLRRSGGVGVSSDNPVFQNIQIELAKVNVDIAALEEKIRTYRSKISELQDLVDVLPQIEAELVRLNRDYDVKQAQYRSLLQRLEIAELSQSAEQTEDFNFKVIEPPRVPNRPIAPNRPLLLAVVLLAGISLAGGAAFMGNQLKPVYANPKELRSELGLPVLGTVQTMQTEAHRRQRVSEVMAFSFALFSLCAVFFVVFSVSDRISQLFRGIV